LQVESDFTIQNTFRCAFLIIFDWMTVDSSTVADIEDFSSSTNKVRCRQSLWQWRSCGQYNHSRTIMVKQWPGCFDHLFRI
jgi:hypothetical protein